MAPWLTPQLVILALVSFGHAMLAVDKWVHGRERREREQQDRIDGRPSVQVQLTSVRASQQRRHRDVMDRLDRQDARIEQLHRKASDEGDRWQARFGTIEQQLARLDQKQADLYLMLERN